jgi:hypothetical protein
LLKSPGFHKGDCVSSGYVKIEIDYDNDDDDDDVDEDDKDEVSKTIKITYGSGK